MLRYVSEERCLALRLCGWISRGNDMDVEVFLRTLEQEREWERAAAVALFNLDIRRAILILNKGATAEKGERVRGVTGSSQKKKKSNHCCCLYKTKMSKTTSEWKKCVQFHGNKHD